MIKIVERTEQQTWTEFEGEVIDVQLEQPKDENMQPQYHISIKPTDREIKGKTGLMHEWIRLSATATAGSLPRGSVADRYIEALEDVHGDKVKNLKTVDEAFKYMKGKKYQFKAKVLGRAFEKNPASEYWVPIKQL